MRPFAQRRRDAADEVHVSGPFLPEIRALAVDLVLRARMKRGARAVTESGLRKSAERFRIAMSRARTPPFVHVEHTRIGARAAEWVRMREGNTDAGPRAKIILYFHGGGFFMSSPAEHRPMTWRLARATGRSVLAVEYRKAPEHAFPAWLDDAFAAYGALLADGYAPGDILVAGDSAGGNIALALVHRLRREGIALPDGLVLFSPWADLACEGATYRSNRRRDAMFDARAITALGRYVTREHDPKHPEVSPIHADFTGFPRMLLFAGSTEVFLDDARAVTRRARAAGVSAELHVYRHMPHVFPMFAGVIPRAKGAFETVRAFAGSARTEAHARPPVVRDQRFA